MLWNVLLGSGRFPHDAQRWIEREKVIVAVERVRGSVTWLNYRSRRRCCSWKRQWFRGCLFASDRRFAAYRKRSRLFHLPFDDDRWGQVEAVLERDQTLLIRHPASLHEAEAAGTVEYRFWVDSGTVVTSIPDHLDSSPINSATVLAS